MILNNWKILHHKMLYNLLFCVNWNTYFYFYYTCQHNSYKFDTAFFSLSFQAILWVLTVMFRFWIFGVFSSFFAAFYVCFLRVYTRFIISVQINVDYLFAFQDITYIHSMLKHRNMFTNLKLCMIFLLTYIEDIMTFHLKP